MNHSKSENKSENKGNFAKIAILGIGGAGVKTCVEILKKSIMPESNIAVLDFDDASLSSFSGKNKLTSPQPSIAGRSIGTGGDLIVGERLASVARQAISNFLNGYEVLIAIAGMGGGTGSSAAPIVARIAKKLGINSIFIVTIPFSFEGHKRRLTAEKSIENLLTDADIVIPIANDILFSTLAPDTPFSDAFLKSDTEIANAAIAAASLFAAENYISAPIPNLKNMLGKKKSSCLIGYGEAKIEDNNDFSTQAIEALIESPLLGGMIELKKSDAAMMIISTSSTTGMAQVKRSFEKIQSIFSENTELICTLAALPSEESIFRITVICARFDQTKAKEETLTKSKQQSASDFYIQDELPLFTPKKGIFTNSSDNFYKNTDLDIPVFQRKGMHIDPGQ